MKILSQRDPRWSALRLGASQLIMGRYGCTTTDIAMIEGITPDILAKNPTLYTKDGLVIWTAFNKVLKNVKFAWRDVGFDPAKVDAAIKAGKQAILFEVDNGAHWVAFDNEKYGRDYLSLDPWDATRIRTLAKYGNITKVVYFDIIKVQPKTIPADLEHMKGTLVLDVDQGGRLYYIDTKGFKHDISGTPEETQQKIAKLSQGITHANLSRIPE